MAKRFLDTLGNAFEEDILEDVIPAREFVRDKNRKSRSETQKSPTRKRTRRKTTNRKSTRKSFLQTLEDALDNHAFDDFIPENILADKDTLLSKDAKLESRLSTMITTEVLNRAREIARNKGIPIRDVITIALKWYIDKEGSV